MTQPPAEPPTTSSPSGHQSSPTPPQHTPAAGAYGIDPATASTQAAPDAQYGIPDQQARSSIDDPRVIQSDKGVKSGLSKCGRCGATDINLNIATGLLHCNFCRHEWSTPSAHEILNINGEIGKLNGVVIGSGAQQIVEDTDEVVTLKCGACGAEVVIDTEHAMQSRCHWCRNTLSMNQQIPNGAVPDMVLPFKLQRDDAVQRIARFVRKRQFFAHPRFKKEFNPENVLGVYLPYMVIDVNGKVELSGVGEHTARKYTVRRGKHSETRYDADVYNIQRRFDVHINDLTVESSSDRLNQNANATANNIINTIMPFDVENSVQYNANYLKGFTSERRDADISDLVPLAQAQCEDIARYKISSTLRHYDRGVKWNYENLEMQGQRWVAAYLPVWLYSYVQHKSNGKQFVHYVAVNGRTGETMGSVPVNQPKLLGISAIVQVVGTILGIMGTVALS